MNDLVDTYFVGNMPDSVAAQAGMSLAWPLISILTSFNMGLAVAGVAIISQFLGAGKKDEARKYSGMLTVFAVGLGIIINIVLYFIAPPVLKLMGAEGDVYTSSVTYVQVRSFEMVFTFIFAAFQSIRQSKGDTLTPVIYSTIGIIVNICLNALFIEKMGMGVFGAALATVIGMAVRVPFCLYHMFIEKGDSRLTLKDLKVDFSYIVKLTKIAMPSATAQAFSSLGFLILQMFILSYGDEVAAAFSLGNKVSNLLLMPVMALGGVLATFVGQNIGNSNKERAVQSYRVCRNLGVAVSVIGAIVLMPVREWAISLLSNDPETVKIGTEYTIYVLLMQPLMAMFQSYLSLFNGAGKTQYSFIMTTVRLWALRIPMILVLKNFTDIGRSGIWWAMLISNFLVVILGALLYRKVDFSATISKGKEKNGIKE